MGPAVPLAFAAAAAAVLAVAELLATVDALLSGPAGARARTTWSTLRAPGHEPTAPERRQLTAVLAATALVAGTLLAGPPAGVAVAVACPAILARALRARGARHRAAMAAGAPVVARALADALAGGHSIRGALGEVAREAGPGPALAAELRHAEHRLLLGDGTLAVLEGLRARAGGGPWDTIVAAVGLQHQAGGDLAGLLRDLAVDLEAARRAVADARAATAQARTTARIVCGLPLAGAVLAELAAPGTISGLLGAPATGVLVGVAVVLQVAALGLISRLARPLAGA